MTEKKSTDIMVTQQGGVVKNVLNQLKLIFRLMGDSRVNIFAKIIPVGAFAYLLFPLDAISLPVIGVVDDAALIWLSSYLFTELCPPDVVQEHVKALAGNASVDSSDDNVVDAETTDIKE